VSYKRESDSYDFERKIGAKIEMDQNSMRNNLRKIVEGVKNVKKENPNEKQMKIVSV
jgi:hypothetical protein